MKPLECIFDLHRSRSGLVDDYAAGDVPYVGNGFCDNAVAALVLPMKGDKVFQFRGIAVSAFCEATVQSPPFIGCGRAGNGVVVLEPKTTIPIAQLAYIAAYINVAVRWRFSWYRQTTADRLRRIPVPDKLPRGVVFPIRNALPQIAVSNPPSWRMKLLPFALDSLYEIVAGDFHSLSDLKPGTIPVVSCGDADNGVSGYFAVEENLYQGRLTIAFNGMNTLTAKYHPYQFAAKDDVAICVPRRPLRVTTEIFIQMMINRERWRYSYYRKCFADKLRRLSISLPAQKNAIDEDTMQQVVEASSYWKFIRKQVG